jgi:large subunit ribosomal protein L7A
MQMTGGIRLIQRKEHTCLAGTKQTRKAILNGLAEAVLLAEDADPAITEPLEELCRQRHITVHWISSMKELGSLCGLAVGAAAAAQRCQG